MEFLVIYLFIKHISLLALSKCCICRNNKDQTLLTGCQLLSSKLLLAGYRDNTPENKNMNEDLVQAVF